MTILITGANRGVGRGLFDHYVRSGHTVIGTQRGDPGPATGTGSWTRLDVQDPASFTGLAQSLDGRAIDLLVCNAGVYVDKGQSLEDGFAPALWADTFATNVTGVFLTVQSLLANLQQAKAPRIAIISSQMGSSKRANGGSYIYRASKAAALNLGLNLANDLRAQNIAVGIYHPGWVRTDMGGGTAAISVDQSVAGLVDRFDHLSMVTSGCFLTYDGQTHPA